MPDAGDLLDARAYLGRFGLCGSNGMGMTAIEADKLRANLEVTGGTISPFEADAALLASDAYVSEHHRSNEKSTDAPWDWPRTEHDLQVLKEQQTKQIESMMGG